MNILISPSAGLTAYMRTKLRLDKVHEHLSAEIIAQANARQDYIFGIISARAATQFHHATVFHISLKRPKALKGKALRAMTQADIASCGPVISEIISKKEGEWVLEELSSFDPDTAECEPLE